MLHVQTHNTHTHITVCTDIANCADIRCTNSTDQMCHLCNSNNGPGLGERGFTNLRDECEGNNTTSVEQ